MVYERIVQPQRVNLWEFEQVGEPDPDDLVVIYLENGDRLHVTRDKTRAWRPVKQLMPATLREVLKLDGDGFTVSRGVGGIRSGYVGDHLILKLRSPAPSWSEEVFFVSEGLIRSIRPQPRDTTITTQLTGEIASWNKWMAWAYKRQIEKAHP